MSVLLGTGFLGTMNLFSTPNLLVTSSIRLPPRCLPTCVGAGTLGGWSCIGALPLGSVDQVLSGDQVELGVSVVVGGAAEFQAESGVGTTAGGVGGVRFRRVGCGCEEDASAFEFSDWDLSFGGGKGGGGRICAAAEGKREKDVLAGGCAESDDESEFKVKGESGS